MRGLGRGGGGCGGRFGYWWDGGGIGGDLGALFGRHCGVDWLIGGRGWVE